MKRNNTLSYYKKNATQLISRYESAEIVVLHSKLKEIFSGSKLLLDIGCGSGREASFLVKNGFSVNCIEGSQEMIQGAIKLHPELKEKIQLFILPKRIPKDKVYDGIYSIAFLMHLNERNVKKVLTDIFSILRSNGKLFLSVPLTRPDLLQSGIDSVGRYFLILSENRWKSLVTDSGFSIEETFTTTDGLGRKEIVWFSCVALKPSD